MNPEQLASEELSQWREKTMRKELEMIREVAEEEVQLSSSQTIRKMTYKGEVEIEKPARVSMVSVSAAVQLNTFMIDSHANIHNLMKLIRCAYK